MAKSTPPPADATDWPDDVFKAMKARNITTVCTIPDGGLTKLLQMCEADATMRVVTLSTEEEGIGYLAGAWLGGERGVLLMQSSGVGNCINALALPACARLPLLMVVTMRGDWAEFNPWQNPMSHATQPSLEAIGVTVVRADTGPDVVAAVDQAAAMAFQADQQVAVLIGQRLLGRKVW